MDIHGTASELMHGDGYVLIEDFFDQETVDEARERIYSLAETEPDRTAHFHGDNVVRTQKRVWNLIEKGRVFRRMASDERLLSLLEPLLGDDLQLASWAANVLYPNAPAQEPHVDYPYWDMHTRSRFPKALNASFFLEIEVLVMLDEFTVENGGTALMPGSQRFAEWPIAEAFTERHVRITGGAGSLLLFPNTMWHAGQANRSDRSRAALLGAYTCKFVKSLEDWSRGLSPETVEDLDDRLRRLLCLDYPYPAVMDELEARSSEGAKSTKPLKKATGSNR